ncbi:MAG: hypothetical protein P8N50_01755, partial [Actinomycetota bacterium]|nr:hypothetical protein [Actinomycetota bacterium]
AVVVDQHTDDAELTRLIEHRGGTVGCGHVADDSAGNSTSSFDRGDDRVTLTWLPSVHCNGMAGLGEARRYRRSGSAVAAGDERNS